MTTLKSEIETFRKTLNGFGQQERAVRDFLLFCLPKSVLKQHREGIDEMCEWFATGAFEHKGQTYPLRREIFRAALKRMWDAPAFTVEGKSNPAKPLKYLKTTMVNLLQEAEQQKQAAGVQVVSAASPAPQAGKGKGEGVSSPPLEGGQGVRSNPPAGGGQGVSYNATAQQHIRSWCTHTLDALQHADPSLDLSPLQMELEAIRDGRKQVSPSVFADLHRLLWDTVFAQLGSHRVAEIRCDAEQQYEPFKSQWDVETYEHAVREATREAIRRRYRLPAIA